MTTQPIAERPPRHRTVNYAARRLIATAGVGAGALALSLAFGHRGTHAVLSLVVPGGGLLGVNTAAAVAFLTLAVVVIGAWLRWGVDWLVIVVAAAAMVVSAISVHDHELGGIVVRSLRIERSAHEFPLVMLVVGVLSRLGRLSRRLPLVRARSTAAARRRREASRPCNDRPRSLAARP